MTKILRTRNNLVGGIGEKKKREEKGRKKKKSEKREQKRKWVKEKKGKEIDILICFPVYINIVR